VHTPNMQEYYDMHRNELQHQQCLDKTLMCMKQVISLLICLKRHR
jgi:hypothetical protein